MAKRPIFTAEIPTLGPPPKYSFDISPSYQRLKGAGEQTLGEAEESGMFGMGWKALMVPILMGIKVLDTPRILFTDILGNILESGFEFMFNLLDGRPGDAYRSLASNAAEIFTDTGRDIFTLDLETTRDGVKTADDYYRLFGTTPEEAAEFWKGTPAPFSWLRFVPAVGFEILQDPTSFVGVGEATGVVKNVSRGVVKGMSKSMIVKTAKLAARFDWVANNPEAKAFMSDVVAAIGRGGADEAIGVADQIITKMGGNDALRAVDVVAEGFTNQPALQEVKRFVGQAITDKTMGNQLYGKYLDVAVAFGGRLNAKAVKTAGDSLRREFVKQDDILEFMAGKSDEFLRDSLGMTEAQIRQIKSPIDIAGKARRYTNLSAEDLIEKARLAGMEVSEDGFEAFLKGADAEAIINASRKYGGDIQVWGDMFDTNPYATYWAFSQDLTTVVNNPGVMAQNIRTASNVSRALGVGWYSNPFWYMGKVLPRGIGALAHPSNALYKAQRAIGGMWEKRQYSTLFGGDTTLGYVQDVANAMEHMNVDNVPNSRNFFERIKAEFMWEPTSNIYAPIADEGMSVVNKAWMLVFNKAARTLHDHGDELIGLVQSGGKHAVSDAIQMSGLQRAAYDVVGTGVDHKTMQAVMEAAGTGEIDAVNKVLADLKLGAVDAANVAKFDAISNGDAVKAMREFYKDILETEQMYNIGGGELEDVLSYFGHNISPELRDSLADVLKREGHHNIVASLKGEMIDSVERLWSGVLKQRKLKGMPLSYINARAARPDGVEFLKEIGLLDIFTDRLGAGNQTTRELVEDAVRKYLTEANAVGREFLVSNPVDAMKKRLNRHYLDATMSGIFGAIEQSGRTRGYGLTTAQVNLANIKRALEAAGVDKAEIEAMTGQQLTNAVNPNTWRAAVSNPSKVGKGVSFYLPPDAAKRAMDMGYNVSDDGKVLNLAPSDFDEVLQGTRYLHMRAGKKGKTRLIYDREAGTIAKAKKPAPLLKAGKARPQFGADRYADGAVPRGVKQVTDLIDRQEMLKARLARMRKSNANRPLVQQEIDKIDDMLKAANQSDASRNALESYRKQAADWHGRKAADEDIVQRYEEPGVEVASPDKPHGIYTTPAKYKSPHDHLGGKKTLWKRNKDAKVLDVSSVKESGLGVRDGEYSGVSAGLAALHKMAGASVYNSLRSMSKAQIVEYAKKAYPGINWKRYYDTQEIMEGIAGMMARERGYDAIKQFTGSEFDEFVALTKNAMSEIDDIPMYSRPELTDELWAFDTQLRFDPAKAVKRKLRSTEAASEMFRRIVRTKGIKGGIPKAELPKLIDSNHQLVLSRKKALAIINAIESAEMEVEPELIGQLYDFLNKSELGFMPVDLAKPADASTINRLVSLAGDLGIDTPFHQIPKSIFEDMSRMNVNMRSLANKNPAWPLRLWRPIMSFIQRTALAGTSTLANNMFGNPLYAMQGGITANMKTMAESVRLYEKMARVRPTGKLARKVLASDTTGKEFVDWAQMTVQGLFEQADALGVTQGWVRSSLSELPATQFSKEYDKFMAKATTGKRAAKFADSVLSFPGMAIGVVCDDSMRFVFWVDAVRNRGFTMDEAATLTKEFFGDFTPLKQTKFDRTAQDFVLFYKFRKWNTIQQMRVLARDPKWASYTSKLMRMTQSDLTADEMATTKLYREKYEDPFIVARRDDKGNTWDRNGKVLKSQYALANPFGSWFSPSETLLWLNPLREAKEAIILSQEVMAGEQGILGSFFSGVDAFYESLHIDNPELAAEARMRAAAHFTNTNRITRYAKPYFQGREGWQRDSQERLFRTQYTKYVSLQEAMSAARKRVSENDPAVQENARMYFRINKLYNQISTLKQRKPYELTPYDWD